MIILEVLLSHPLEWRRGTKSNGVQELELNSGSSSIQYESISPRARWVGFLIEEQKATGLGEQAAQRSIGKHFPFLRIFVHRSSGT